MTINDFNKVQVISNIRTMEKSIGKKQTSFEELYEKSYQNLHEKQNAMITDYNKSVKPGK